MADSSKKDFVEALARGLEVIRSFEEVSGQKLNYKVVERREGDVISAYADTNKANNVLSWEAKFDLKDALLSAWKWESSCM